MKTTTLEKILRLTDRIELHPATDEWMKGDRYGVVVGFSRNLDKTYVTVLLDKSNAKKSFHINDIYKVIH